MLHGVFVIEQGISERKAGMDMSVLVSTLVRRRGRVSMVEWT